MRPMAEPTGVYDTYDGLIAQWRGEGYTLQEIGDKVGVTRERIRQILNRYFGNPKFCLICGKGISAKRRYCPECRVIFERNPYRFLEKRRRENSKRCKKWRESHREKYREICRRATSRYMEKRRAKHYAETTYVVTKKGADFPVGHQFKAIGTIRSHLVLADGSEVATSVVRKIDLNPAPS